LGQWPVRSGASNVAPDASLALLTVISPIFLRGPIALIAPRLKVNLGSVRQKHAPCAFKGGACLLETRQTVFGEKYMRYALIIAMLLGSTLLAQDLDHDKWVGQIGRANKTCLAKFRQKFGEAKDHNYADCVTDQTNKEIDTCIGKSEFSNCVHERSLKVLEVCDLSKC
jgi:hypothetical protein